MFTRKDIDSRSVFVINCFDNDRSLRLRNGELLLAEQRENKEVTLTKFPFQKILMLFVIGNITITTPLIEKCQKFAVALVVTKINLRPVFIFASSAEGNFLLRQRQYDFPKDDVSIAKVLVKNKILNQRAALSLSRKKDDKTTKAIKFCENAIKYSANTNDYHRLMGIEGAASKVFFAAYFQHTEWSGRYPRTKCDAINTVLDIGYTMLFNFMECIVRLFGFDVYVGVYHRLWFKRKSLICDLIEPFRCIIDHATLLAFNRKQFSEKDFEKQKQEYRLKREKAPEYYKVFCNNIIEHKTEIFVYVQQYYRCFMRQQNTDNYPKYLFK